MRKILLLTFFAITTLSFSQNAKKLIETIKSGGKIDHALLYPKSAQALKTSAIVQKIDSMYYWNFSTSSNSWTTEPYRRFTGYTYDANNNRTSRIGENYFSSNWFYSSKEDNMYDANNNNLQDLNLSWCGSSWNNNSKNDHTYNASNNKTSSTNSS